MIISGKNIVVTGAASGIGKHVVTLLLQHGAKVLAVDRADLLLDTHHNLFTLQADISSPAAIDDLFTHAVETLGGIDAFIANAGFAYYEKLEQPDWQRMEAIYKVNVLSPIYSLKKLVQLNGDKPCSFVAVSSAMAYLGVPGYAQYAGTKGALHRFMETYRNEHHHRLHLMVVYPIATKTNFFNWAGNNIPVAWPTQEPQQVAKAMVNGLMSGKRRVYPSFLFQLILAANRYFPFVFPFYLWLEQKKFQGWMRGI